MNCTAFLASIPAFVTEDNIRDWLDKDGLSYKRVHMIRKVGTISGDRAAFIECHDSGDMEDLVERYDGAPVELDGGEVRYLKCEPSKPKEKR